MTSTLTHFIGGQHVEGTSGRFGDVYNPATGEVEKRAPLASAEELRAAVLNAKAAQPAWAAQNPQRRARVLMKFVALLHENMDSLAEMLSREHGKTLPDAKGDIIRGLEVAEFTIAAPHMMKGEFTDSAGPGIDMYSMRQPLGVVAGITPFNFPAMIPMWKFCPAIAAGNAFILKPSERDPSVPLRLAELMIEAGLPAGVLNVVNGDKEAVDAILDDPDIQAVGFVGSTPIAHYVYSRATANGKRAQCFGGAKNHMIVMPDADLDQATDALIGSGYGSAGERCMAISVAVPVGEETADRLIEKLTPRVEQLKIGPYTAGEDIDFGPVVTAEALQRIKGLVGRGIEEGAELVVDGRGGRRARRRRPRLHHARLRERLLHGRLPVRSGDPGDGHLHPRDLRPGALGGPRAELRGRLAFADGARVRQRGGHLHPRWRHRARFHQPHQYRHGRRQRADPGAARLPHLRRLEALGLRRSQPARPGRLPWKRPPPAISVFGDDPVALGRKRGGLSSGPAGRGWHCRVVARQWPRPLGRPWTMP
jgi:malonate-semialdehyde dehydrogenase (acetylating)/methylmalonate-semialdehyde dehydrogenase